MCVNKGRTICPMLPSTTFVFRTYEVFVIQAFGDVSDIRGTLEIYITIQQIWIMTNRDKIRCDVAVLIYIHYQQVSKGHLCFTNRH
jgi:hypothetical protein